MSSFNSSSLKWNDDVYPADDSWGCDRECIRECIWMKVLSVLQNTSFSHDIMWVVIYSVILFHLGTHSFSKYMLSTYLVENPVLNPVSGCFRPFALPKYLGVFSINFLTRLEWEWEGTCNCDPLFQPRNLLPYFCNLPRGMGRNMDKKLIKSHSVLHRLV